MIFRHGWRRKGIRLWSGHHTLLTWIQSRWYRRSWRTRYNVGNMLDIQVLPSSPIRLPIQERRIRVDIDTEVESCYLETWKTWEKHKDSLIKENQDKSSTSMSSPRPSIMLQHKHLDRSLTPKRQTRSLGLWFQQVEVSPSISFKIGLPGSEVQRKF